MKTLTKIRLINWHYFENETIDIKNNTLLTGQNASGKSTILDAVSFVLTAGDQNFNLAANEKGKRDLRGYVKCKLGSLDQEYLRDYDLSGHICLEFYSQKQEKFFCLGTIIDVIGNIQAPKVTFYILDGPMKDEYFISEDYIVRSSADFKKAHYTDYIFQTRKEAKTAFRSKMGGVSEKYFSLLPKALAFKPITDVKDYIYNHLLEQREIDVKNIQDSIRSYKEFEAILKTTKNKIADLEKITNNYYTIKEIKENQDFYDYLLKDLKRSDNKLKIEQKSKSVSKIEKDIIEIEDNIKSIDDNIERKDDRSKQMYASLSQNKDFRANELFDRDIKKCESDLRYSNEKRREYERRVIELLETIKPIQTVDKKLFQDLNKLSFSCKTLEDVKKETEKLDDLVTIVDEKHNDLVRRETDVTIRKNDLFTKIQDVYKSLSILSKNSIPYSEEIIELRRQMEEHLRKVYGENISVHILSEIIEVKDASWQDTVENFLGNQRFTLIVEPKYYDDCLDCYNQFKSRRIYGINLLNTKKIQEFRTYQPNSLASIIETENKDARCYINYLIGNLIMVSDVHELDKHSQSITKSGMLYRGFTTRYLNPNTEKPFIGKNAQEQQRLKYTKLGEELKSQFQKLSNEATTIDEFKKLLQSLNLPYLKELLKSVKQAIELEINLADLKEKKEHISLASVNELRREYENILDGIRVLNQRKGTKQIDLGVKRQAIEQINNEILALFNENQELDKALKDTELVHVDYKNRTEELFNKEREEGKSTKEIEAYYTKEITDQISSLKSLESGLIMTQVNYISKYNRPFGTGFDRIQEYLDEQDKLIKSELVKYEAKVRESREEAEKLFKEDFLSKLRSYIMEAQDEISKINETLDKISFGRDKYQFVFPKSKEFSAIYDMIVNDMQSYYGGTIFDEEFERKYNQELDELFSNLSQDEGNSQGNLNKYTDYRTYMDYDIKVISGGDVFYFSNISKEKSGGETQIPFYVAILASFVRLFDKAEKNGLDDSIGLIMFDEVFDKMDTQRTDAMMEFISHLNVQIIFACPPQKMESLSKHTDTTVAVYRDNKQAATFIAASK
ncbi:AAA family ATPase [bacterium]|nr:AAA family ATPase [bacterium]